MVTSQGSSSEAQKKKVSATISVLTPRPGTMALRGALQLSRLRMMKIELPEFSKSRFARRANMMDEDRVKWYNWNLACIALTAVPLTWMWTVNYRTCEEVEMIYRTMDPMGTLKFKYDLKLFGS